jgi:hypothetical protein
LCLAWNGIDTDAAKLLGHGLNDNTTLAVLDVSGCRLNAEGFMHLIMTSKLNTTLKSLLVSRSTGMINIGVGTWLSG